MGANAGAELPRLGIDLAGADSLGERIGVIDGGLQQLEGDGFEVGFRIDLEGVAHLLDHVAGGVGAGADRRGAIGVGRSRRIGHLADGGLKRGQRSHVLLVGGPHILDGGGGRGHYFLHGVEGLGHFGRIHGGVLRGHPEQGQQRGLRAGKHVQLFGGVLQVAIADHHGIAQEVAPARDVIRGVAVLEILRELRGVGFGGGVIAQHPALAAEELVGLAQVVLHGGPTRLGERAQDVAVVDHHLGRAGELLVEVDFLGAAAGVGEHELIDLLGAGELREVQAGAVDGGGVVLFAEGIAAGQILAVEIELLARQRQQIIHQPAGGPTGDQNRRKPVGASLPFGGGH